MTKQRRWMQSAITAAATAEPGLPWTRRKAAARAAAASASANPAQTRLVNYGRSPKIAAR